MKIENVIYIITHPQFPGYVKIGYASDLKQRLSSLNTGNIVDFEPYAVYETPKDRGDTEIHDIITLLNPILRSTRFDDGKEKKKEFFKLDPEEAFKLLEHIAIVSGTRNKLYRVDKYFNKIDVQQKPVVVVMPSPMPAPQPPAVSENDSTIPDGIYTMKTKIKSLNKTVQGTLEVKNGKFILKAGSDVAPESARYERNKMLFTDLKINNGVLTEDKEFGSVSTAACIVRGGATNGWDYWKNSDGQFINIYRKNN